MTQYFVKFFQKAGKEVARIHTSSDNFQPPTITFFAKPTAVAKWREENIPISHEGDRSLSLFLQEEIGVSESLADKLQWAHRRWQSLPKNGPNRTTPRAGFKQDASDPEDPALADFSGRELALAQRSLESDGHFEILSMGPARLEAAKAALRAAD